MENKKNFGFGTQIRKSPYFDSTVKWGATGFSVYNHMYIPRDFGSPEQNFWNLVNNAILCDVSVERQVEITGPDAARFTQYICSRDISKCEIGQCKYVLLTDQDGGVINDPILLKLAEDHFWLSIADSDVLLWARGVAVNTEMDVKITEPDVSPLQLQGPKSRDVLKAAFGDAPTELKYFRFIEYNWHGIPLLISRTGWSGELGYEIYLRDGSAGNRLWEHIMDVGTSLGLKPGHTSTIRRIEAGLLSYQADMTLANNPYELGLDRLINLEMETKFIGKEALKSIKENGIKQKLVGLEIEGDPFIGSNDYFWPLLYDKSKIGTVSSAIYNPRLKKNIALGMVKLKFTEIGTKLIVDKLGEVRNCYVVSVPFNTKNQMNY